MLSFLRGLFLNNIGTKIMAILLAMITLYEIHTARVAPPETMSIPLVIETPAGIISQARTVDGEPIKVVNASIEYPIDTPKEDLSKIVCHKVARPATEPLEKPLTLVFELHNTDFNLKRGFTINDKDINPSKIQVILMQETVKSLRLKTEGAIVGAPMKGYRVTAIATDRTDIKVKGPQNILDKYTELPIAKVDVTNSDRSFSQKGEIEPIENVLALEDFTVRVTIDEELAEGIQTVKIGILMPSDFPDYPIQIKPQEKTLKFRGPASAIKELKPRHINLFVDISTLIPNLADLKPPASFAPQLELRFTADAPKGIKLAEPLDQIKLDVLPIPPAPASGGPKAAEPGK